LIGKPIALTSVRRLYTPLVILTGAIALLLLSGCMTSVNDLRDRRAKRENREAINRAGSVSSPEQVGERSRTGEVLRVNEESLTADEFWNVYAGELRDRARTMSREEFERDVAQWSFQLIPDRINEMLLYQHARRLLPEQADKRIDEIVDGEIRRIITREHRGVQRIYENHLAAQGRTIEDVRNRLRREIVIAGFIEREIKPRVAEPTRAELLAIYDQVKQEAQRPLRRKMSLIDIRTREFLPEGTRYPTEEQRAEARRRARTEIDRLASELRSGADFATLAREHSHGLHAPEGGTWGWIEKGSVRERFVPAVEALYNLAPGQVSQVIETDGGFFLVRCDEKESSQVPDFQNAQPELKDRYLKEAFNRRISKLLSEMQQTSRIEPRELELYHRAVVEAAVKRYPTLTAQ